MSEQRVQPGKVVSLTYTITDPEGEVLEAVEVPVDYIHGHESGLFEQVEASLEGKAVGEVIQVTLAPEQGFGQKDPNLTYTDAVENVPPQFREMGAKAEFVNDQGETVTMVVTHIDKGTITLDGNHPFAGKTITFNVKVAGIRDATEGELRSGEPEMAMPKTLH